MPPKKEQKKLILIPFDPKRSGRFASRPWFGWRALGFPPQAESQGDTPAEKVIQSKHLRDKHQKHIEHKNETKSKQP